VKRTVFYLSDRTGITVETLAHSLLTQFEGVEFEKISSPYLDTVDKAKEVVARINKAAASNSHKPLLFSTLIDPEIREIVASSEGLLIDFFEAFINPLEAELGVPSSHAAGKSHGLADYNTYKTRIDSVNFALANDDGITTANYGTADIILIGVSRTGKTPTCLYLALQYGIFAANYPLTEEDMDPAVLPESLREHRAKLFGLSISAERLQRIRSERRPNSRYADIRQCELEVKTVEQIYGAEKVSFIDTTTISIEEIATTIMDRRGLERRLYG